MWSMQGFNLSSICKLIPCVVKCFPVVTWTHNFGTASEKNQDNYQYSLFLQDLFFPSVLPPNNIGNLGVQLLCLLNMVHVLLCKLLWWRCISCSHLAPPFCPSSEIVFQICFQRDMITISEIHVWHKSSQKYIYLIPSKSKVRLGVTCRAKA